MKMHNNHHNWTDWLELIQGWWRGETPVGAVLLAVVMAILRIAYSGGGWRQMLAEAPLCGALTLTAVSALEYFNLPNSMSVAIGGALGFIGVQQTRRIIFSILNSRFGGGNAAK